MQTLPIPTELRFVEIADPGEPNKERIVLKVADSLALLFKGHQSGLPLGEFAVISGLTSPEGIQPLPNHFFWFGEVSASANAWVIVMTGRGTYSSQRNPGQPEVHWFYLGSPVTLFSSQLKLGAAVIRMSEILVCPPPSLGLPVAPKS